MKQIAVVLFLAVAGFPVSLSAQEQTAPIKQAERTIAEKFPSSRFFDFEYEMLSPFDYTSKIHGENYEEGRIKSTNRYIAAFNYPVTISRRLSITPNVRYKHETLEFENVINHSANFPTLYHDNRLETHYVSTSMKTTYISKLFGKPMVYNFNLMLDASDKGYEHMAANLVGLMVLKRNANTTFTLGLVASFDKTSMIPVFPLVSYEHRFRNSQWSFDMFFPKHIYFRRPMFTNGRLSLGTVLSKDRFFGHPGYSGLEDSYNVVKRKLKTGFVYEQYINKHFILSAKAGIVNTVEWEVAKKTSRKAIIGYFPDMNMYFIIGFSFNL